MTYNIDIAETVSRNGHFTEPIAAGKKPRAKKGAKRFGIKYRWFPRGISGGNYWQSWKTFGWYETAARRDQALEQLRKKNTFLREEFATIER